MRLERMMLWPLGRKSLQSLLDGGIGCKAILSEIIVFIKGAAGRSLSLSVMCGHSKKASSMKHEIGPQVPLSLLAP